MYDNEDSVCGIIYNNEPYYFQKNLQGDVIGIVDRNANVVATYSYDAWGECISNPTGIAAINPFRYRGYYYDSETGMYYLQSRYYDPNVGRFINADEPCFSFVADKVIEHNLVSYCRNSVVGEKDPWGYISIDAKALVLDFALLVLNFSPWKWWIVAIQCVLIIPRLIIAIKQLSSANDSLRKRPWDTTLIWNRYSAFVAVSGCIINILCIIAGWRLRNVPSRVGSIVLTTLNKIWGTAFYGTFWLIDSLNFAQSGIIPPRRKRY